MPKTTLKSIEKEFDKKFYPYIHSEIVSDEVIMKRLKLFLRTSCALFLSKVVPGKRTDCQDGLCRNISCIYGKGWNAARQNVLENINEIL